MSVFKSVIAKSVCLSAKESNTRITLSLMN